MKNRTRLLFLASSFILIQTINIFGQTLKADYQFQGNLSSSVGTAPALTDLVGAGNGPNTYSPDQVDGFSRQVLNFPLNNGVAATDLSGILTNQNSFTMVLLFKMGAMSGHRRLADISGGTQANQGPFMVDGRIQGESTSTQPANAGTYIQIIVIRGGGTIKYYRDGVLRVTDVDSGFTLPNGFRFFQDYINNPIQASGGSIARLRFYDGAMTDNQVAAIDRVPESVSGPMPLLTFSDRFGYPNRFRMNTDGTSQKRLTSGSGIEFLGRFSPDGQKIVYMQRPNTSTPPTIWISNSDGSNPVPLTSGTNDQYPSWRPDGQKIIFSRCTPPVCDIYTMNPDGSNVAALTAANTANSEEFPRYTPDGSKIVFACSLATNNLQLCTANADGSNRVQITNIAAPMIHRNLDVSPDGTKIMCIRGTDASTNRITIMNLDGSQVSQLSQSNGVDTPIWSPNGTQIAYSRKSIGSTGELHVANADGTGETRITFNSADDTVSDWYRPVARRVPFDYDGDGKTDFSVFRPTGGAWYLQRSTAGFQGLQFGAGGDKLTPADYDGDGKTDIAVFRPSSGQWFVLKSSTGTVDYPVFGAAEDLPAPGDFDGDGKADLVVFRPSQGIWYRVNSANGSFFAFPFGQNGDVPTVGDFDGDGKNDYGIFRPSIGDWYNVKSSDGSLFGERFGQTGDRIAPADYDGDGKTDIAIFRPSTGLWVVRNSAMATYSYYVFGSPNDVPISGDYDGDGKADIGVWRPSDGTWYIQRSDNGQFIVFPWGQNGDTPTPAAFGN